MRAFFQVTYLRVLQTLVVKTHVFFLRGVVLLLFLFLQRQDLLLLLKQMLSNFQGRLTLAWRDDLYRFWSFYFSNKSSISALKFTSSLTICVEVCIEVSVFILCRRQVERMQFIVLRNYFID